MSAQDEALEQKRLAAVAFGLRLKDCRDTHGWTQDELARRSGVARSTIALYEAGKTFDPSAKTINKLARTLHVKPRYLRRGEHGGDDALEDDE